MHGSFLAAAEFVSHTGDYMGAVPAYFESLCDSVVKFLNVKSPSVHTAILALIPILAGKQPEGALPSTCILVLVLVYISLSIV